MARCTPSPTRGTTPSPRAKATRARSALKPSARRSRSKRAAKPPTPKPDLLPQHAELIRASDISPEVAAARGYRSIMTKAELKQLGFSDSQRRVPALLIPVRGVTGEIVTYQIRPDEPRIANGKPLKYETPSGTRMSLDVPPGIRSKLGDPTVPLFITEGARKADAAVSHGLCCIALLGVWNWRGTNEWGGQTALADWESIALRGRRVYIVFDSDVMLKEAVHLALGRLKAFLEHRRADVAVVYLPAKEGGSKVGLDDFLASGHTTTDLLQLARPDLLPLPGTATSDVRYEATPAGLVWLRPTQNGDVPTPITNFTAKIVGQVIEDDGAETRRLLELEAIVGGRTTRVPLMPSVFSSMSWPLEMLGPDAAVFPGFGFREHAKFAIQTLSGSVPVRHVYTHIGWHEIDGQWLYLHAGGAIGPNGPISDIDVRPADAVAGFALPALPAGNLPSAVRKSLAFLELAPKTVTVPLYATHRPGRPVRRRLQPPCHWRHGGQEDRARRPRSAALREESGRQKPQRVVEHR